MFQTDMNTQHASQERGVQKYIAKVMVDAGDGGQIPINAMLIEATSKHEAWMLASIEYGKTHPREDLSTIDIRISEVEHC
jgi:hypothetical protein